MPFFSFLEPDATIRDLLIRDHERMEHMSRFTESVLHGPSPLTAAQRELIAAYVSGVNLCEFCHGAHKAFAEAQGIDIEIFEGLMDNVDDADVDERLKPILRYARKLTLTPSRMTQADADAVFAAGWEERALEDAILVTALFNFYNRYVDGHGIEGRPLDEQRRIGELIKTQGYVRVAEPSE